MNKKDGYLRESILAIGKMSEDEILVMGQQVGGVDVGRYTDRRVALSLARYNIGQALCPHMPTNTPMWQKLSFSPHGDGTTMEEIECYDATGKWPEREQTEDGE